ncbi:uncharacterized threonine-rich GPI-anchored glycoprotein PJ4664.02-like [Haliotis rufescens]|uniref:uncharacterized threonine-rich GPI-anchored glycoprotein PJ4664.02-like n=1 Tax=Haliotis rufescens TaxID=6454 RepID=UPI00201F43CA|nr:uncharacterized threonine-rich GPI-anchored glycoprotein PJ4664.02-like [Haliotis rufescens]
MDFILLSVYILTNICISLGGMTPKTIIIASETSRWIHQSGTPPLKDYHGSQYTSSHNRASPYITMTSVPVQTPFTSSVSSSISTTTSTSANQPIVPSTTYHQASATKVISPRYSYNHTNLRTTDPIISDSASDSSTHTAPAMQFSDVAQTKLHLQSSMVAEEYGMDTLGSSQAASSGTVNTETMNNLFETFLETVADSSKVKNHQTQKSTSSVSTFDILRDYNFTASQIADWFESGISKSKSKSNTTSASDNSAQTDKDIIDPQSNSAQRSLHTSTYSKGSDDMPGTPLSLLTTPTSISNTIQSADSSRYSSSDFMFTNVASMVKKTDSIKYSSASDFLVTYSLINVFKAHSDDEGVTQTTKGTNLANTTSLLGNTSLSHTTQRESVSQTSDLDKSKESYLERDLQKSLQSPLSSSAPPSTENTEVIKTLSLRSQFMSETSSHKLSTKSYEDPEERPGEQTPSVSELSENHVSVSKVQSENARSAFSSETGRNMLSVTSSRTLFTDATRTQSSDISSMSQTSGAGFPNIVTDLRASFQPDKGDLQTGLHSTDRTTRLYRSSAVEETSWTSLPLESSGTFIYSSSMAPPKISQNVLSTNPILLSSELSPFLEVPSPSQSPLLSTSINIDLPLYLAPQRDSSLSSLLKNLDSHSVSQQLLSETSNNISSSVGVSVSQEDASVISSSGSAIVTDSWNQPVVKMSEIASYSSVGIVSDIKPSASNKRTFASTLLIDYKSISASDMTRQLSNQPIGDNVIFTRPSVTYSSDQSVKMSSNIAIYPSHLPVSDIKMTANEVESSSSIVPSDVNTVSTVVVTTSSSDLPIEISTTTARTFEGYSSNPLVSDITVSSLVAQLLAPTSMEMHSSELHSKSNAEPFLQMPSISINIKTKHSKKKGSSGDIHKDSPSAVSTAHGHSTTFIRKEDTLQTSVNPSVGTMHNSMSAPDYTESRNAAAKYIKSSSSATTPNDYSSTDTGIDTVGSSLADSRLSGHQSNGIDPFRATTTFTDNTDPSATAPLDADIIVPYAATTRTDNTGHSATAPRDADIIVPYAATMRYAPISRNEYILGAESSSFYTSSPVEDYQSLKAQITKSSRTIEDADVTLYSIVDSSHNVKPQPAVTGSQASMWPAISDSAIPKQPATQWLSYVNSVGSSGGGDPTVHEIYRLTSDIGMDVLDTQQPSSIYQHTDQPESTQFYPEGMAGESINSALPNIGMQSHSGSIPLSTSLNQGSSKTTASVKSNADLLMSTDMIVSNSDMDQIMEQSLILTVKHVADKKEPLSSDAISATVTIDSEVSQFQSRSDMASLLPEGLPYESASPGTTGYHDQDFGSRLYTESYRITSSSALVLGQPQHSTSSGHIRSTTPLLHTSKILEPIATSSQYINSISDTFLKEHPSSQISYDAIDTPESLGSNVESSDVQIFTTVMEREILSTKDLSIYTPHASSLPIRPTQSIRGTQLLSEMSSNKLTSTIMKSIFPTTSTLMTSSANPQPTVGNPTQDPETESRESDFILKWVFDPKGEDVTSAEFLAKVVKGLELSYEKGLKRQVNVRLRRDTVSTSNVNVQIKSTKPRSDGSMEMEFTVIRNGQKVLAKDAEVTFNKISSEELNHYTGVKSLGMMGLTSLQQEQVLVNDLSASGKEAQRKSNINSNTNDVPQPGTSARDAMATVETKDSRGDVLIQSKTTEMPERSPSAKLISMVAAAHATTDTQVSGHVMTSIDKYQRSVSSALSNDVIIEMVIISNQRQPEFSKEMQLVSSTDINNGFQQKSMESSLSTTRHIHSSVTLSESSLMSEDTTYYSVLEQVTTPLGSELRPSSGEPSQSLDHDHQATVFTPLETERHTSFPNAVAAWDDNLVTTFDNERLPSTPLYNESPLSGIDESMTPDATVNELIPKNISLTSTELFLTLATNDPQLSSDTASVRSSYELSFSSSLNHKSATAFIQATPKMTSSHRVPLKPITYLSSSVLDSQNYILKSASSLATQYSEETSPSDMIDAFPSFSTGMDAFASSTGKVSLSINVGMSSKIKSDHIVTENQTETLSSSMSSDYGFDTLFDASGHKLETFVSHTSSSTYMNITRFSPANRSNATRTDSSSPGQQSPFDTRTDSEDMSSFPSVFEDLFSADSSNVAISSSVTGVTPTYEMGESALNSLSESVANALEPDTLQFSSNDVLASYSTGLAINPTSGAFTNEWSSRTGSIDSNIHGTETMHITGTMLPSSRLKFSMKASMLSPVDSQRTLSQMSSSMYTDDAASVSVIASMSQGTASLQKETSSTSRIFVDAFSLITAPTPVETAFSTPVSSTKGAIPSTVSSPPDLKISLSSKPNILLHSTSSSEESSPILPLETYRVSSVDVSEPPPILLSGEEESSGYIISSKSFTHVPMTTSRATPTIYGTNVRYSSFQKLSSITSAVSSLPAMDSVTDISSFESSIMSIMSSTKTMTSSSVWTVLSVSTSPLTNTKIFPSLSTLALSTEESSSISTISSSTEGSSPISTTFPSTEGSPSLSAMTPSTEASSSLSTISLSTERSSSLSTISLSTERSSPISTTFPSTEGSPSLSAMTPSTEASSSLSTISLSAERSSSLSTISLSTERSSSLSTISLSTERSSPISTTFPSTEGSPSLSAMTPSTEASSSLSTISLSAEESSSLSTISLSTEESSSLFTMSPSSEKSSSPTFLLSREGSLVSSPALLSTERSSSTTIFLPPSRTPYYEHSSSMSTNSDINSSPVYPTVTLYSHELTQSSSTATLRPTKASSALEASLSEHNTGSQPSSKSVLPSILIAISSWPSSPGGPSASATTALPINPSTPEMISAPTTTAPPINPSTPENISPTITTALPINPSTPGETVVSATALPIKSSTPGKPSVLPTSHPVNPSTPGLSVLATTTLQLNSSSTGETLVLATTALPINPSTTGGRSTFATTTLFINPPSSREPFTSTTITLSTNPSSSPPTIPTSEPTMSTMPSSVQQPDPESSTIPVFSTAHPDSSSPPPTTTRPANGPPVDTLMLLIMNIGLDVNISSTQFSRQLEKDLAELYETALKQRRRRDVTERLDRYRRQSGVNAQVVSNERDPGDDFKVTTTFAVSDGGDFVTADVAVPVYNRMSQEQISTALAHSVLEPITAAQTSSRPQLEDKNDTSYILILCIVIPVTLLILAVLFLVTRMRRRRRANAVGDLPPRYQRGETLEDHNLTVDVEKGEIVDKTPASTPCLTPRSNSSTSKKVPLLGGVCVLPGVGDGDGLRRQDSDKYRELTETDYSEQVLLADQEKGSHRSLILREKELLEKLGVHEIQKEVDSCDEQTLELPRRTRSKKGKGKAASSQYNTVGSECPLLPSSGSMTTVSSIDSGDHTDASDEFTVIIPKTKSPKIDAKNQKESISTQGSASDDAAASMTKVSEFLSTSVVQASEAEPLNVCPETRSVDTQTSKDASLTSDTDSSPDEKGETSKMRDNQGCQPGTESKQVQTPWVHKIRETHDIFIDDDDLSCPNSPVNTRLSISAGSGETSKFIFPETLTIHKREEEARRAQAQQLMVEAVQQRRNLTEHAEQDLNSPSISSLESDSDVTINSDQLSLEDDSLEDAILALGPLQIAQQTEMTTTWSRKSSGVTYVGSESGESSKEYRQIYPAQGCVIDADHVVESSQPEPRTSAHKYTHDSSSKHSHAAHIEQEAISEEEEAVRKTEETTQRAQQLLNQTHALGFALAPIGEAQSDFTSALMERIREEVKNSGTSVSGSKPSSSKNPEMPVPRPRMGHSGGSSGKHKHDYPKPSEPPVPRGPGSSRAAPRSSRARTSDSTAALLERVRGELQRLDSSQSDSDSEAADDVPSKMPKHQTRRL